MTPDSDELIGEWKQLSTDFDPDTDIEFLDEDDLFELVHDSEL